MENKTVRVWDIPVRVFHWSLVAFFALAYFTGDEENQLHIYAGYVVAGLILLRILWGLIGTRHARFSDFIYSPRAVSTYLKGLVSRSPRRYLGHTPAGGWMILALLMSLLLTSVTGLQVYGLEGGGPLAEGTTTFSLLPAAYADDDHDEGGHDGSVGKGNESAEELWEEAHEFFANLTVLLVLLHVAAVVVTGRLHNENLVKAMVTGNKGTDTKH